MNNKESFILYCEQEELVNNLTDEQAGKLLKAIYRYADKKEILQLDQVTNMAMISIRQSIDRNTEKYEKVSKTRAEAGSRGGKQRVANQANATFAKQIQANPSKSSDNDPDPVPDPVPERDNDNEPDLNTYTSYFLNFWSFYPKRIGGNSKEPAFRWWKKRLKEGYTAEKLTKAAKDYQLFCNAKDQTGTDFVFKASNFLGRDKHFLTDWEEQAHAKANTAKPKTAAERYQQTTDIIRQSIKNDCDKMPAVQNDGDMGQ